MKEGANIVMGIDVIDKKGLLYLLGKIKTSIIGSPGKSAYDIWLEEGHIGTQNDFLNWIKEDTYISLPSTGGTISIMITINEGEGINNNE